MRLWVGLVVFVWILVFFSRMTVGANIQDEAVGRGKQVNQKGVETAIFYLSGRGKDDAVEWDFYCTAGDQSGKWTKLAVPSNWELHGFGSYNYGRDSNKSGEQGKYRRRFRVPETWRGRVVHIVFEGSMTDTEVWVNGKRAGPKHQGGFYRFRYDITGLIEVGGENLLEVAVSKQSSNRWVEAAERKGDYWVFGGIYRPVYLTSRPSEYIDRCAIDARADGIFSVDVYAKHVREADRVEGRIRTAGGENLGEVFGGPISTGQEKLSLATKVGGHQVWSAENPNLYFVELSLLAGKELIHKITERFGFRTIEVREGDGIFLNGQRIRLKGVNRHSFWPDSGRCLSHAISIDDVKLMKAMNMNAVRMSHYPPDTHFLDVCDELGMYVLDELAGWQKPPYDTESGKRLVKQMVTRDVNHPCILFWDNGNEGGWNRELDGEFSLYDPQGRRVLHPWDKFGGIDTDHYEGYASVQKKLRSGSIYMPTEFLHGLYDGGHGAGLNDMWELLGREPLGAGGFLWVLTDEGVVRTDRGGVVDVYGNNAPDGIVGPYREKEGSFYTIKEIWSPVQIAGPILARNLDWVFEVENHYDFRDLSSCRFEWELKKFSGPGIKGGGEESGVGGIVAGPAIKPGEKGSIRIALPENRSQYDVLYFTAIDKDDAELWTWSWGLKKPIDYRKLYVGGGRGEVRVRQEEREVVVEASGRAYRFDKVTCRLTGVRAGGVEYKIGNGPRLVPPATRGVSHSEETKIVVQEKRDGDSYVLEASGVEGLDHVRWRVHASGVLELAYRYRLKGEYDFFGVTFDFPEEEMTGMRWLGQGPYRVWKNRLRGTKLGVWERGYNDSTPGESWEYPEFKGYFADLHWAEFQTRQGPMRVFTDTSGLYLRMFTPKGGENPRNTAVAFPEGDISFLHEIGAIGTKFKAAKDLGPESQKNKAEGVYEGRLYFVFGVDD